MNLHITILNHTSDQSAENMDRLLLLLTVIGLVPAADPIDISVQLGSDLHLAVADVCQFIGLYHFDISNATKMIGTYDMVELQPRNGYKGRLAYNTETCTITLKSLTEQDGTTFTVTLKKDTKSGLTLDYIHYRIHISDPLTSPPYKESTTHPPAELTTHNTSLIPTDDILGFVSLCLSLDSPVNALFLIALWIIQGQCNKPEKDVGDLAGQINSCFTFAFQVVTICTLSSGNLYSLFLSPVPILLLVDILKSLGRLPTCVLDVLQCNDDMKPICKKIVPYVWRGSILLIQILFAVVVGILYNTFEGVSRLESRIGFIVLSIAISIALKIGVFFSIYCYKTKPKFSSVLTHEATTKPGDPEGPGEEGL